MADARLSIGVNAVAKQASATFKELAADIKTVGKESVAVTEGVSRVDAALAKLASAPDTPGALAKAIGKAKVELEDFRAALERTPASAEKMRSIETALAQADAALARATERAARLKDATEEVGGQMQVTAKGAEALTGSFGSLQGILGKMADSTSSATQGVAKLGFQLIAVGEAFKFGYQVGQDFNKFLQEHGNLLERAIDTTVNWVTGLKSQEELLQRLPATMNTAIRAKQQLSEEMRKTLAGLKEEMGGWQNLDAVRKTTLDTAKLISERYTQLKSAGKDWRGEVELQAPAINATAEMLGRLGIGLEQVPLGFRMAAEHAAQFAASLDAAERAARLTGDGIRGLRDTLELIPNNLQDFKVTEVIDGLSKAIQSAAAEGKDWSVILTDYERELRALADAAQRAGVDGIDLFREKILSLIPAHEAAAVALGSHTQAIDKWLADQSRVWEQMDRQAKAQRERESAEANRTSKAPDEFKRYQDAALGAAVAAGELGTNLDRVAEAVVATGGQMVVGAPIMIQYAAATKEAKEELLGFLAAQRALREEQSQVLAGAQGWLSILANLTESYRTGETSLYNYITQLQALDTQVRQLFGGATGDAKTAVDALTDAIAKLIATAAGSGPGSYTPGTAGLLERELERGKEKR